MTIAIAFLSTLTPLSATPCALCRKRSTVLPHLPRSPQVAFTERDAFAPDSGCITLWSPFPLPSHSLGLRPGVLSFCQRQASWACTAGLAWALGAPALLHRCPLVLLFILPTFTHVRGPPLFEHNQPFHSRLSWQFAASILQRSAYSLAEESSQYF